MEGSRRQQTSAETDRGRSAATPAEIPKKGWRDIFLRTKEGIERNNLSIIAGGTAFFLLLGLVPGMAAVISVYGLIANASDVEALLASLSRMVPTEARSILEDQLTRISSQHQAAGVAALVSLVLALWGGAAAIKAVMKALNVIYG